MNGSTGPPNLMPLAPVTFTSCREPLMEVLAVKKECLPGLPDKVHPAHESSSMLGGQMCELPHSEVIVTFLAKLSEIGGEVPPTRRDEWCRQVGAYARERQEELQRSQAALLQEGSEENQIPTKVEEPVQLVERTEETQPPEKAETAEQSEKAETAEQSEKAETAEQPEKAEHRQKAQKPEKAKKAETARETPDTYLEPPEQEEDKPRRRSRTVSNEELRPPDKRLRRSTPPPIDALLGSTLETVLRPVTEDAKTLQQLALITEQAKNWSRHWVVESNSLRNDTISSDGVPGQLVTEAQIYRMLFFGIDNWRPQNLRFREGQVSDRLETALTPRALRISFAPPERTKCHASRKPQLVWTPGRGFDTRHLHHMDHVSVHLKTKALADMWSSPDKIHYYDEEALMRGFNMIRQPPSLSTETEAVMKHLWDTAVDSSASLQKDFAALESICTKVKCCPYKSLNLEVGVASGAPPLPVPITTRRLAEAAPSYLWTVILHCGEDDPDEWISELLGCDNSTRNRRRGWQIAQEAFFASWSKFTKSVIGSLRPKLISLYRRLEKDVKKPLPPLSDRLIHQQFTTPEELHDMHRRLGQRRRQVYRQMQEDLFCASWESMTRPIVNLTEPVSDHAAQRLRGYIHLLIEMELDNAPYASIKEPWLLSMLSQRLSDLSCNLSSELACDLETQVDGAVAEWQLRCRQELEPPQESSLMEPIPLERGLRPCLLSEKERKDRERHSPYRLPMPFPGPYRIAWNTVGSIADRDRVTDPPSPGESDSGGRSRRSKRMRHFVPEEFVDSCGRLTTSIAALSKENRRDLAVHLMSQDLTGPIILIENHKGRAVIAYDYIERGSFVCQYKGEFIESPHQAAEMEKHYEKLQLGCYMFYFGNPLTSKKCCIDSTDELLKYGPGRLVNHGRVHCNLQLSSASPKTFADGRTTPVLYFVANRNIYPGEELLIDYGDRDPQVIRANPWLKY